MLEFQFPFIEQPRLFDEAVFQIILGAAGEDLVFGGLRDHPLYELGDAMVEILEFDAFFHQFLRRRLELDALGIAAVFHRLQFVAGPVQPFFQRLNEILERDDLNVLGIGEGRLLVQLTHQLGQLRFLVGQGALGFVHGGGLRLNLSLERDDLHVPGVDHGPTGREQDQEDEAERTARDPDPERHGCATHRVVAEWKHLGVRANRTDQRRW